MFQRRVATLCAATAVLFPSLRLGHDVRGLLQPGLSAAEATHEQRLRRYSPTAGAADPVAPAWLAAIPADDAPAVAEEAAATNADSRPLIGPGEVPLAFGFGTKTSFFPSTSPRELVLSFDDGPDLKYTPIVLDELDRRGLKAIFFITGHRLMGDRPEDLARRELVRKIAARGHLVSNHTLSHSDLCQKPDDIAAEIDGNSEVIAETTGVRPLLFRAPYGARCRRLEAALAARGLVSVGWNLDPQDWKNPDSAAVLTYLEARLQRLQGRGILLLHDTHASSVFALGPLLDWIDRENRLATRAGTPPIVLRDYSVFLPERPVPATGWEPLMTGVLGHLPRVANLFPSFVAHL